MGGNQNTLGFGSKVFLGPDTTFAKVISKVAGMPRKQKVARKLPGFCEYLQPMHVVNTKTELFWLKFPFTRSRAPRLTTPSKARALH